MMISYSHWESFSTIDIVYQHVAGGHFPTNNVNISMRLMKQGQSLCRATDSLAARDFNINYKHKCQWYSPGFVH